MSYHKRYITDCSTNELSVESGDDAWNAEREQARLDAPAKDAELLATLQHNLDIHARLRLIAEKSIADGDF